MMNVPEAGGREERRDFGERKTPRKATKAGEYKSNREEDLQGGEVSDG